MTLLLEIVGVSCIGDAGKILKKHFHTDHWSRGYILEKVHHSNIASAIGKQLIAHIIFSLLFSSPRSNFSDSIKEQMCRLEERVTVYIIIIINIKEVLDQNLKLFLINHLGFLFHSLGGLGPPTYRFFGATLTDGGV